MGLLRIHAGQGAGLEVSQAVQQGSVIRQGNHRHIGGSDRSGCFLLHPGREVTRGETEEAILGEGTAMHRLSVQQMGTAAGGAAPRQKGRRQEPSRKGS